MNENPTTRIVPQKCSEIVHINPASRPPSRMSSCRIPLSSAGSNATSLAWECRSIATQSIATQTSDEEGENRAATAKRQPRWKRSARQRKSIAVMEPLRDDRYPSQRLRSSSHSTGALTNSSKLKGSTSMDNVIDGSSPTQDELHFLTKFRQLGASERQRRHSIVSLDSKMSCPTDNVVLSKTVRKEKRRQEE